MRTELGVAVGAVCLVALGCGAAQGRAAPSGPLVAELESCTDVGIGGPVSRAEVDPRARGAAQRGLDFLAADTIAWQRQHDCYGCHVQAVTLDAMIVGRRHHFRVGEDDLREVLRGLLDVPGGARGANGFSVGGDPTHLVETSRSFGGAALAEYDEHVSGELEAELIATADALLEHQDPDGSVRSTDHRPPVVAGLMQSTGQAARVWRQAHARTADDRWLLPIHRAEEYIRARASQLTDESATDLQDLDYAIIGLLAAGATPNERVVTLLARSLRARQGEDGGWSFRAGGASDAFATGQALYVLRRLGAGTDDAALRRGVAWLTGAQNEDGSWSTGGDRRGEAMWAVLGLVSVDVMSLSVTGLEDGARATAPTTLEARAESAEGTAVRSLELRIDDVLVRRACAGSADLALDPSRLRAGAHRLDVVATDARGQVSRRRLSFYTGDHFLTSAGARFEGGRTIVSLRNLAPRAMESRVRLTVFRHEGERGERVWHTTVPSAEGAMSLAWEGRSDGGEEAPRGRYLAELVLVDAEGRERHRVEVPFVHDTAEAQDARFGQVAGQIDFDDARVEGAQVELLDEGGRVVQTTTTTRSGRYRFRHLDEGRYRVRVRRAGFRDVEASVETAPASAGAADLELQAQ